MTEPFKFQPLRFAYNVTRDFARHGRQGIDIGLSFDPENRQLVLLDDAKIVRSTGFTPQSGNAALFERADGVTFSYSHLAQPFQTPVELPPNFVLFAGSIIGEAGSTGNVRPEGATVLHLRVRDAQGRDIDPEPLLDGARFRGTTTDEELFQEILAGSPAAKRAGGGGGLILLLIILALIFFSE